MDCVGTFSSLVGLCAWTGARDQGLDSFLIFLVFLNVLIIIIKTTDTFSILLPGMVLVQMSRYFSICFL